jgi:hypothetical protein
MRLLPLAVFALLAASSARARAAPPSEAEQARRHFEAGTKAFNLGEFKRAVEEYKAAYNSKADPVFLYNIAQAYRLDNNLQQSLFFYKSYLVNSPRAPNRREVEERIHKLETQLAEQRALTSMPPNAPVPPGGTATTIEPDPATVASTSTTRTEPRSTTTTTTEPKSTTTTTATTTTGTSGALTATAPKRRDTEPVYKKWWLWTVVGVGVVGIGLGVGLGVGLSGGPPSSNLGATRVF